MASENSEKNKSKMFSLERVRENPWILSSFFLGIVLVMVLLLKGGGVTGNVVSSGVAANNLISFVEAQSGSAPELVSSEKNGSFYQVTVNFQGQDIPVYVTLDGKYLVSNLVPLEMTGLAVSNAKSEIPKSDRPKVELFIWSYCPYGVQAQAPLASTAALLGNDADFEAVLYYGGHGAFEVQQNKIQACIQEIAKDKYWAYAESFVKNIYPKCGSSQDINCDKTESINLMNSLGIDSSKIMACVAERGEALTEEHYNRAGEYGVTGSPTLVINGVAANAARNAEAYKSAVCEAFTKAPAACSTTLSSSSSASSSSASC